LFQHIVPDVFVLVFESSSITAALIKFRRSVGQFRSYPITPKNVELGDDVWDMLGDDDDGKGEFDTDGESDYDEIVNFMKKVIVDFIKKVINVIVEMKVTFIISYWQVYANDCR
ncbi:MAG: hypothetical protein EZS28_032548, partial [Streblomastix strix]